MNAIQNLSLQVFCGSRNDGDCFMEVCIEFLFLGLDDFYSVLFQYLHEFVVDKLNAFSDCCYIGGSLDILKGTLKVVDNRQNAADTFSAPFRMSSAFSFMVRLR